MSKLVIDIETVGEEFDALDEKTKKELTRWIERESKNEKERDALKKDVKEGLGFSPLTGEIIVVGMINPDTGKGMVYFQNPQEKVNQEEEGITFATGSEAEILQKFWETAANYAEFITFNGNSFDIPYLMIRSAIHKVRPSKNLMSNRYLSSQWRDAKHVDLQDQLTFYGAMRRRGTLHLWCRAFGIKSPKTGGVSGDDVARLFREGKYWEIACYNARDLRATAELYDYWNKYLRF